MLRQYTTLRQYILYYIYYGRDNYVNYSPRALIPPRSRGISNLFPAHAGNKWIKFKTSHITDKELKLVDPQPLVISTIAANNLISKDSALRAKAVRLHILSLL